ncbi:UDP-N-acetylmuramoyl-L-alanine--D-glutamate ligase [Pacificimonas flava]|uniref:UDP-N-acetylmuramoylalanine--D-glutamate ligase n=2 Tax=Pacificimonas TaxID=1960290 RepID=A0A219B6E6_9SPHN|nr:MULTISPECIES: UDP-N-acetylmuramoyl-L-alanine--D-glutamate ligase [Pacificimonas]MBZ6378907.1 UDP-N-acetylmuramoyl-L-alanine--D-glutamate ligase [Pacificimonas aurantium]OWV33841.1 UDP-N-acetylmuramoyl-L-alanine--D-glutamate ligase [Pacificimonas flava]
MITSGAFSGRAYHVLGLARTGKSVVDALLASGAAVAAWDDREEARAATPDEVEIVDPLDTDLSRFDALIVSPGVPLNTHPLAARAAESGVPVIGDIELFAQARAALPAHRVVGITGTNGKSTTTALVHHALDQAGIPARLGGNIGAPILSQAPLPDGGVYVLELSSYQIDLTKSLACDVAILLNITPDHLDRYDNHMEDYAAAKARLFAMQDADGVAVITGRDRWSEDVDANRAELFTGVAADQPQWPSLAGPHNLQNAVAAATALRTLGLAEEEILSGFRSFSGLAHRMERLGEVAGVEYVNDSKATNAESAAPALAAFRNIHWIIGGRAKSGDLSQCAPYFGRVKSALLIGEAADLFRGSLQNELPLTELCGTLEAAVCRAAELAVPGDTVLLSPACASFDQFRDFEERGERFRTLVGELSG